MTKWGAPGFRAVRHRQGQKTGFLRLPGKHIDPQSLMHRLRGLGINLLGAPNAALRSLLGEVPPLVVAERLGYSCHVIQHHAEIAAQRWQPLGKSE